MEVRRDPRQFLFFIILLLLINSHEPPNQTLHTRSRYNDLIDREWAQLDVLNRTRWGDFAPEEGRWVNVTGLREEDGWGWDVLGDVKSKARERMGGVLGERAQGWLDGTHEEKDRERVYRNVSGFVEGEWVRHPRSRMRTPLEVLNATGTVPAYANLIEFDRNLTGSHGMVRLHLAEMEGRQRVDGNGSVGEIKAKVVVGDADSWGENWWEFNLNGVHYPAFGGAVLTTTSER